MGTMPNCSRMRDVVLNEWGDQPNYTILAAAIRTGRSVRTIERWVRDGLRCREVAGMVVIEHTDLMDTYRIRSLAYPNRKTRRETR